MYQLLSALITAGVLAGAGTVHAGNHSQKGGWQDTNETAVSTVQQVRNMQDDAKVAMKGKIEKHLKRDKYQFRDGTGFIVVEIDDDVWNGQTITPQDTIFIFGELDSDPEKPEVDVERLKKQ